jgi:serine/threonine-protein kinase RIO1
MMEKERTDAGIEPPDPADFEHQMQQVRIFSQLVHNTDLNPGNILITEDWKVWVVDFTRAFRVGHELEREELGGRIDRSLYTAMRDLDRETVVAQLSPYLTEAEIEVVMAGSDQVVAYYDEQIAAKGAAAVLCDEVH